MTKDDEDMATANPQLDALRIGVAYTRSLEATGAAAQAVRLAKRAMWIATACLALVIAEIVARHVTAW